MIKLSTWEIEHPIRALLLFAILGIVVGVVFSFVLPGRPENVSRVRVVAVIAGTIVAVHIVRLSIGRRQRRRPAATKPVEN